jgi:hypothetical protein
MSTLRELLKDPQGTEAFGDTEWMGWFSGLLLDMSDEYLAEALRTTMMACAFRLSGVKPPAFSFELVRHGMDDVLELVKEGMAK